MLSNVPVIIQVIAAIAALTAAAAALIREIRNLLTYRRESKNAAHVSGEELIKPSKEPETPV